MTSEPAPEYRYGELRIAPALGRIANGRGDAVRLGPVNMKVLVLLLSRPGEVIGRSEIFEAVWPNQVVSEDALTRCVSDIRGQLRRLSGRDDWIETLPKRGYRWLGEADETRTAAGGPMAGGAKPGRKLARIAGQGLAYLAALIVMAMLIVWSIDRFSRPGAPVVAVLPVAAEPAHAELAAALDVALTSELMALDRIRVLARSAVESRPPNPFPFFYYEFGARWLVEGELRVVSGRRMLTIDVVDARTGIVEVQFSHRIAADGAEVSALPAATRESLERFIDAQLGR